MFGRAIDAAIDAAIPIVGVPLFSALIIGSTVGALSVLGQARSNGDTTLDLGPKRAKPCEMFEDVGERLPSQVEAQRLVRREATTDAVCYMGRTAEGATWYSTGRAS